MERLRASFRFAIENGWIEESPARHLKPPIVKDTPTLPFTREDMARILEHAGDNHLFILMMRYTDVRISDNANAPFFVRKRTTCSPHLPAERKSVRPAEFGLVRWLPVSDVGIPDSKNAGISGASPTAGPGTMAHCNGTGVGGSPRPSGQPLTY